jgi:anthranilate 1,2-dioxygenase large subunit
MLWTMFGYETDDEEMVRHRLRQGNLMGPSGFLGLEDNEAIKFVQEGLRRSPSGKGVVKLGGDRLGSTHSVIDEAAIRGMYAHYRKEMGL